MTEAPRTHRNLHPTPEAVFAMYHWHDRYAAQRGGTMDFFDALMPREQQYCRDAVERITQARTGDAVRLSVGGFPS